MSLPINVANLISRRTIESARIEYKEGWNPEKAIQTICAFANDIDNLGGGYIIFGIEDDGGMPRLPIKGLERGSIDRINREMLQACSLIEPRYVPVVEHVEYDGKDMLVVWAPGGSLRPYKCPDRISASRSDKTGKSFFIRRLSSTVKASPGEERDLFDLSSREPFDDRANHSAEMSDLRSSLISDYLGRVGSDLYSRSLSAPISELALDMRIAAGPAELLRPINAGLMFFNESPDRFFRYARIEVVDKPDPTGEGMTEKTFTGPLNVQLEDALRYIRNYVIKERVGKDPRRPEAERVFNYPFAAVEEALSNAVYHKDYQIPEPITVTVTPVGMEILSLPGPDRSITDADLERRRLVAARYRNRRIGDFLKELRLIEGRNTGIPAMLRSLESNGSGMPTFETDSERSYFRVTIPVHERFAARSGLVKAAEAERLAGSRRSAAETEREILKSLSGGRSMSVREMSRSLGYRGTTAGVSRIVRSLADAGIIEYEFPDKMNSRNQKIRMTGSRRI